MDDELIVREWMEAKRLIEDNIPMVLESMKPALIPEVVEYIVEGGKRFRGFLTILTAKALGGRIEDAIDAAIAIELVHSASLALDDMVDGDEYRRGRPSAWIAYNTSKTSLATLLIIAHAQRIVEKYGYTAIKKVIRAWESTVKGEIIEAYTPIKPTREKYIELIELKTASLFKLAAELGTIASKNTKYLNLMAKYGKLLGIIYQITDDMADYINNTKNNKKPQKSEILYINWIKNKKEQTKIEEKTIKIIKKLIKQTQKITQKIPQNKHTQILKQLPKFTTTKMLEETGLKNLNTLL